MVTGASTADAVVVLVDARKGVLEQTRRHLAVVALLRVPHVIVAVNKIDLVDFTRGRLPHGRRRRARRRAPSSASRDVHVMPVSRPRRRQHRRPLGRTRPGTTAPRCSSCSRRCRPTTDPVHESFRLPVQVVIRPQGAARSPEHVRLPRVCRPARLRLGARRRRGRRAAVRLAHDRRRHRPRGAVARRSPSRRSRCRSGSPTTSTSAAATSSPRPRDPVPLRQEVTALACWLGDAPLRPGARAARQARVAHGAGRGPLDRRPARPRRPPAGAHRPAGAQRHRPGHGALRVAAARRAVLDLAPRRRVPPRRRPTTGAPSPP